MAKNADVYVVRLIDVTGTNIIKLPLTPSEIPEISSSADVEEFRADGKSYSVIHPRGRTETSIDFRNPDPLKKLSFTLSNTKADEVITLLKGAQKQCWPIRYMVTSNNHGVIANDLFGVTSYSYKVLQTSDYEFSVSLVEWTYYENWEDIGSPTIIKETTLSVKRLTITEGQTKKIYLKNYSGKVTWKTSNGRIATVNSSGVIKANRRGNCKITAINNGKKYSCAVTVKAKITNILSG